VDSALAACEKKISKIEVAGAPLDPVAKYRINVNSFPATRGDGFAILNNGRERVGGDLDTDAMTAWFAQNGAGVSPGLANRSLCTTQRSLHNETT
jgi:5'-nucleotidase